MNCLPLPAPLASSTGQPGNWINRTVGRTSAWRAGTLGHRHPEGEGGDARGGSGRSRPDPIRCDPAGSCKRPGCSGAALPSGPRRSAHLQPDTAGRPRSWLRAPLECRWPGSSAPEESRSAGAARPWLRRVRCRPLALESGPTHRPRRSRRLAGPEPPCPAPRPPSSSCSSSWGSAPEPLRPPMGGQGGQRRWSLPRLLPCRMALGRAAAATAPAPVDRGRGRGGVAAAGSDWLRG